MDASGGMGGVLAFDYAEVDTAGTLAVYSGLDGTGTQLADVTLPVTTTTTTGLFLTDQVNFSGVAYSVVFTGGNQQLAFDDLTWTAVPEPSAAGLLLLGLLLCASVVQPQRAAKMTVCPLGSKTPISRMP
jgi:hypothetical protein